MSGTSVVPSVKSSVATRVRETNVFANQVKTRCLHCIFSMNFHIQNATNVAKTDDEKTGCGNNSAAHTCVSGI